MVSKSGRGKAKTICVSISISVLIMFGVCIASVTTWNPSSDFSPYYCLCDFLNVLKMADGTAARGEAPISGLRDQVISASQFCVGASSYTKIFEGRSGIGVCAGIAGTIFVKPEPNGVDVVSLE